MKDDVLVTREHGVMTITLNRPSKLNALTLEMHDLINAAITEAKQDSQTRVLVITAVGRAFCAGDDLKESDPRGTAAPEEYTSVDWHKFVRRLRALPKPTIAALNGLCCGAGIGLALGCDLRVASDRARFADIFIKRGIVGGAAALTQLLGSSRALELIYTGDFVDAEDAHRMGLFNRSGSDGLSLSACRRTALRPGRIEGLCLSGRESRSGRRAAAGRSRQARMLETPRLQKCGDGI